MLSAGRRGTWPRHRSRRLCTASTRSSAGAVAVVRYSSPVMAATVKSVNHTKNRSGEGLGLARVRQRLAHG